MTDIVKRARDYARNLGGPPEDYLTWQLADEIERLRNMLDKIAKHPDTPELIRQYAAGMLEPKP
jgi:hypothetical protein